MKKFLMFYFLSLLISIQFLPNGYAQDYTTRWNVPEEAIVRLGRGIIYDIKYSQDGSKFAVATSIGIWIYDALTGRELKFLNTPSNLIKIIEFSPDDNIIAGASSDEVLLWNMDTEKLSTTLPAPKGIKILYFSVDGSKLTCIGNEGQIRVWNLMAEKTNMEFKDIKFGSEYLKGSSSYSFAISPDRHLLAAVFYAQRTYQFRVWNINTGKYIRAAAGDWGYGSKLVFSPNSKFLASVRGFRSIGIWEVGTDSREETFIGSSHSGIVTLVFSPKGKFLAAANRVGVRLYNKAIARHPPWTLLERNDGFPLILNKGKSDIYLLAFSPDEGTLLAVSSNGTISAWNTITWDQAFSITEHPSYIKGLKFTKKDGTLTNTLTSYSGFRNIRIQLWDLNLGKQLKAEYLDVRGSGVVEPYGGTVVSTNNDGTIKVWDVKTKKPIAILKGQPTADPYNRLTISHGGEIVASGGKDTFVRVWNTRNLKQNTPQFTLKGHTSPIENLTFSPDGKTLASSSYDTTNRKYIIRLWNMTNGKLLSNITPNKNIVKTLAFSPDGKILVTASGDDSLRLWNITNATQISVIKNQKGVSTIQFAPDGKTLVIGKWNGTINVCRLDTNYNVPLINTLSSMLSGMKNSITKEETSNPYFRGHTFAVSVLEFSPNGKTLASGSKDGTILLWDWKKITSLR